MAAIYIARIKCIIRDRNNIFWTFLFPIVLVTLFNLAFSNFNLAETFNSIPVGVIKGENNNQVEEIIDIMHRARLSEDSDAPKLFTLTYLNKEEADDFLKKEKIKAFINLDTMDITVKNSGIEENILRSFIDSYIQSTNTIKSILNINPEAYDDVLKNIEKRTIYLYDELVGENPNPMLNYFYVILAMASLFGSFWGLGAVVDIQANLSPVGARVNISPANKVKLLACNLLAAFSIHLINLLILFCYMLLVLKVDFGDDILNCIAACFTASALGVSFGAMLTSLLNKGKNFSSSVLTAVSMVSSFLAGLMFVEVKYKVTRLIPFIQYINPAHIITDAFYSLYYYETTDRFLLNIFLMIGYTLLFNLITYLLTRRKKYASI